MSSGGWRAVSAYLLAHSHKHAISQPACCCLLLFAASCMCGTGRSTRCARPLSWGLMGPYPWRHASHTNHQLHGDTWCVCRDCALLCFACC